MKYFPESSLLSAQAQNIYQLKKKKSKDNSCTGVSTFLGAVEQRITAPSANLRAWP